MDLFKEALELAGKDRGAGMSPEIMQRMQAAMARMGVTPAASTGTEAAEAAALEQGQQRHGRHHHHDAISQLPQGFIDPIYQGALSDLHRWMTRNERYRNQGDFERLEPVFQAIKALLG